MITAIGTVLALLIGAGVLAIGFACICIQIHDELIFRHESRERARRGREFWTRRDD